MAARAENQQHGWSDRLQRIASSVFDEAADAIDHAAEGLDQLMRVAEGLVVVTLVNRFIDSRPLQVTESLISKNIHIIQEPENADIVEHIESRLRHGEAFVISWVSIIYNLFVSAVFGIISLFKAGADLRANFQAKYFLLMSGVALCCLASNFVGVIDPALGARATGKVYELLWANRDSIADFLGEPGGA
jgi:hypothetical protein